MTLGGDPLQKSSIHRLRLISWKVTVRFRVVLPVCPVQARLADSALTFISALLFILTIADNCWVHPTFDCVEWLLLLSCALPSACLWVWKEISLIGMCTVCNEPHFNELGSTVCIFYIQDCVCFYSRPIITAAALLDQDLLLCCHKCVANRIAVFQTRPCPRREKEVNTGLSNQPLRCWQRTMGF